MSASHAGESERLPKVGGSNPPRSTTLGMPGAIIGLPLFCVRFQTDLMAFLLSAVPQTTQFVIFGLVYSFPHPLQNIFHVICFHSPLMLVPDRGTPSTSATFLTAKSSETRLTLSPSFERSRARARRDTSVFDSALESPVLAAIAFTRWSDSTDGSVTCTRVCRREEPTLWCLTSSSTKYVV